MNASICPLKGWLEWASSFASAIEPGRSPSPIEKLTSYAAMISQILSLDPETARSFHDDERGARSCEFPNLTGVLTRPIRGDLITQQYDEMVKAAVALKDGTATAEAILRRFNSYNVAHPTYKALAEVGKAEKTIFLCDYLSSRETQYEVNDGLQVVENWNSTNEFICYGRHGEMATNSREQQEATTLSLQLLQN